MTLQEVAQQALDALIELEYARTDKSETMSLSAIASLRAALAQQAAAPAQPIPEGFALVPIVPTRAMNLVLDDAGWQWADVLAAADAITLEQYGEAQQAAPQCACKDRLASQCPGEWEPGCDLGNNPAHARVAQQAAPAQPVAQPLFYVRLFPSGLYEGPHHARSQDGRELREAKPGEWVGLYTAPQPAQARQPLTLEKINRIEMSTEWPINSLRNIGPREWGQLLVCAVRAIEAAHGITAPTTTKERGNV